ncbi:unnamed protein product [Protopolystoma xenopodis]|uniref:Uncharacterized protein n=1 Tax=Protopolystoma xenopodis TaxID=117903 RepID=A0A3S5AB89_9PLAT|nr:unnamed protein product [Protopolystoma xenopodis]
MNFLYFIRPSVPITRPNLVKQSNSQQKLQTRISTLPKHHNSSNLPQNSDSSSLSLSRDKISWLEGLAGVSQTSLSTRTISKHLYPEAMTSLRPSTGVASEGEIEKEDGEEWQSELGELKEKEGNIKSFAIIF